MNEAEEENDVFDIEAPWQDEVVSHRHKALSDLKGMSLKKIHRHERMLSDITGMSIERVHTRVSRGDRRTVSDLVLMMNLPEEIVRTRPRQISSSDVVTKFGYAPNLGHADLKLAEEVRAVGTASQRKAQGISVREHIKTFEEEEDTFVYGSQYESQSHRQYNWRK